MRTYFIILASLLFINCGYAMEIKDGGKNTTKKGVGIMGFDPVSYFNNNPTEGNENYSYTYQEVIYHFTDTVNRNKFVHNPSHYAPQYGGWCAYAMGLEKPDKVSINPKTYKLIDNKLYLFYNKLGINTLNKWNQDEEKLKQNADKNWKDFLSK